MIRMSTIALIINITCTYFANAQYLADNKTTNPNISTATPLTNDQTKRLPARLAPWQKTEDQINGNIPRNSLAKLKATNATLIGFLKDSCLADPNLHPVWHGEYTIRKKDATEKDATGQRTNEQRANEQRTIEKDANVDLTFGIRCNFSQPAGPAQPAILSIMANDAEPLFGHVEVYSQDYTSLPVIPTVRNECPYFETSPHTRRWLVTATYDDLPYTILTRREYLESVINSLKTSKEHIIADVKQKAPVRPTADLTTYSAAELQLRTRNYLEHYKTDEEYQKEKIDAATADVDSTMSFIDGMLHRLAPATLAAPAFVTPADKEFQGFADGEPGSVMLVRVKPTVTDPAAPEKPRFFLVTWTYIPADAASLSLDQQITKKLDMHLLKDLLKK